MTALRLLFVTILVGMLSVIGRASTRCALFDIPHEIASHSWLIATLLDAYRAFVAFWVWVAWKEGTLPRVCSGCLRSCSGATPRSHAA